MTPMRFLYFCISALVCGAVALDGTDKINFSMISNDSNTSVDVFDNVSNFTAFTPIMGTISDAEEFENASNVTIGQDDLNWTSLHGAAEENLNGIPESQSSTAPTTVLSSSTVTSSTSTTTISSSVTSTTMTPNTTMAALIPSSTSEVSPTVGKNGSGNVTSANTSSSSLNFSEDPTNSSLRNSSHNASSISNSAVEMRGSGMPPKGPRDREEAKDGFKTLILTLGIVLLAALVIGTTLRLVLRRHHSPPLGTSVKSRSDIETGLNSVEGLPAVVPALCEEPKGNVAGFNEDTDSVEGADECSSSNIVLHVAEGKSQADQCSSQPDQALMQVEVACDDGALSSTTSNSGILDAISPLHAEYENPNLAVPLERMGSTLVTSGIELKPPTGGSDETRGLTGFLLSSFPRLWFPTSCHKPMTEGIQNLSHLSRTPSLSSTCSK
eukprot:gnl/MRDRNA2_/MRDRNA2_91276_c0_seq1.p1 gnl/MRDRNA2_/MRDRNA2_91276_c0~~gnl/MRDRNA2_/MRDRNA2_91276_c0_seq1.p1  ORF type:complete len:440 (+),score=61.28 gnl/MRDRNA2_/MRDRNA2_91276_c0_seq1:73-1392(+)